MYGVIDIGSNTIRLNIYHVYNSGFKLILKNKVPAGLVNYIENGKMNKTGIDLASQILKEMNYTCQTLQIEKLLAFATAPLRNISNAEYAKKTIELRSGLDIDVLSGKQEGRLSYQGAIYDVQIPEGVAVDIGGGSTELVYFDQGQILDVSSLDIGSLNMFNKYVDKILPTPKELSKIRKHASKALKKSDFLRTVDHGESLDIIGVGGTLRACRDINNFIHDYEDENNIISKKDLSGILKIFKNNSQDAKSIILKVRPERIHTLIPGIRILKSICKKFKTENIYVSEFGVREGYLANYLEKYGVLNEDNNNILDLNMINDNVSIKDKLEKHTK